MKICAKQNNPLTLFLYRCDKEERSKYSYKMRSCDAKISNNELYSYYIQHHYLERKTPNADRKQTPNNKQHVFQLSSETMVKIRDLLPKKQRKDDMFGS